MYLQNKYFMYYYSIINRAKARTLLPNVDYETHHIVPECFFINRSRKGKPGWLEGNPEDLSNKVKLTTKEHIVCHRLLVKMTTGKAKSKMAFAAWRMVFASKKHNRQRVSSRTYEAIKHDMIIAAKERSKQYRHSKKSKKKIGDSKRGKSRVINSEWRAKIIKSNTGQIRGPQSEEWRSNISKGLVGKSPPPFTDDHRKNISAGRVGKKMFNNGFDSILCYPEDAPDGYILGRLNKS